MSTTVEDLGTPRSGDTIGRWRVIERVGSGTFGVVYRACLAANPGAGEYALKLAKGAGDLRFEREADLLSRLHHQHVPRFHDRGLWESPRGKAHPYLVMQWVEGQPLYDWAKVRGLTSRQALHLLAQLARALEATHRHGLHRDVKGDNVLVSSEGDAVLVDFGCAWYEGARELTCGLLPPGTRSYRSPQALRHEWEGGAATYRSTPADDVYALGVTAYHLVTGTYPPQGTEDTPCLLPPSELANVAPELEALMLRMLSEYPSVRGTAGELAEALEKAAKSAGPAADVLVRPSYSMLPTEPAARPRFQGVGRIVREYSATLCILSTLAAVLVVLASLPLAEQRGDCATGVEAPLGSAEVGLADAGVELAISYTTPSYAPHGVSEPIPKKPDPGWKRPPCAGGQRAINGACWGEMTKLPPCEDFYEHGGKCYLPIQARSNHHTSDEP